VPRVLNQALVGSLACASLFLTSCARHDALETLYGAAQGTTYSIQWQSSGSPDRDTVAAAVTAELDRIDALLSNYRPDSVLERFNRTASIEAQALPAELVGLLELATRVHAASDGCFDPTVLPLVRVWGFDGEHPHIPDPAVLAAARARVGLDKLRLVDATHVQKAVPTLAIDMSSIGQGYAVERLGKVLESLGIRNYLVEIGGEIVASGTKPDARPWRIGIEEPLRDREVVARSLTVPPDRRTAVITSGTYRHYFEDHGRLLSHILDPHTGAPVEHGPMAVTVVNAEPTLAAAWGTALTCLGPVRGRATAEQHGIAAILANQEGDEIHEQQTSSLERDWPGALQQTRD
jgi:FAD:protein FMN transferase